MDFICSYIVYALLTMEYYQFTITRQIRNRPDQVSYYSVARGNKAEVESKFFGPGDFRWVK